MKKPRKPKAKRARTQRAADRVVASRQAARIAVGEGRDRVPARTLPGAKILYASTTWADDREKLTLLLLPFFIMAFALAMSQTFKQSRMADWLATKPVVGVEVARATDPLAGAPLPQLPRSAPPVAAPPLETWRGPKIDLPRIVPAIGLDLPKVPPLLGPIEIRLAAPRLRLPPGPPEITFPEVRIAAPAMRLPLAPPEVARPEVRLAAPAMRLSAAPPVVDPPELRLIMPALRLPPTPPEIHAPEVARVSPPSQLPAMEAARPPPIAAGPRLMRPMGPLAIRVERPRPDICVASESLGRHVYPAMMRTVALAAPSAEAFGEIVAAAAIAQTDDLVIYNDKYRRLAFPMGDVAPLFGVCTDVVIRAFRSAGVDLQELVHRTRVGSGDASIAHRRTQTLRDFFTAYGSSLPVSPFAEDYLPGDIVTYHRPQNRRSTNHVAIVTDRIAASGRPMIVHNRGWGPQLEDALFVDKITGHYRFTPNRHQPVLEASRPAPRRAELEKASFASQAPASRSQAN